MSKRFNLPYSTADLFPQAPSIAGSITGSSRTRPGSISANSIGSNGSFSYEGSYGGSESSLNLLAAMKSMFKRLLKPNTLDFETAMWEIFHLITNPRKMYRSQYYHKHNANGKNNYTREDPSFLVLLTIFLSISAIAWGLAYSPHILDILKLILYMVLVDFYLFGLIISTVSWLVTNKVFNNTWGINSANKFNVNYIEWGFCFDVHCNSFLIIWFLLYLVQFILIPLITIKKSFFSLLLGNTLYLVALGYYFVITFYGFSSLPFVNTQSINSKQSESPAKLLQLIIVAGILPALAVTWILTICFRVNVASIMINTYFN